MSHSPNTGNYYIGKGIVTFTPEGEAIPIDLGNVTEFEFEPEVERLPHYSSREGVRTKDLEVVVEQSGVIRMIMEEWTPFNLSLLLLGDVEETTEGTVINIMSRNAITGAIRFTGTNSVGPTWQFDFPKVQFFPEGALSPISDEWGGIELEGEVVIENGVVGTALQLTAPATT
jgi:hypothetical protein